MIVEDEGVVALDIQHHLTKLGYEVAAVVSSGAEAVSLACETDLDLILMDIRLRGEMDGIEAAEQIKARCDIPVIYLTAHADAGTLARAKFTVPFGYIVKPFGELELQTAIEIGLLRHQHEQRERAYARQLEHEIAERKRAEMALSASEARYRLLVETSPDGISLLGPDGDLLMVNQQIADLLCFDSPDALLASGLDMLNIVAPRDRERALADLQKCLAQGHGRDLEYTAVRQDGTEVPVEVSVSVVRSPDGAPQSLICVIRDISARKRAEQTTSALTAERERVKVLRQFLGDASHDLRTPLTTMKTSLYLLEKASDSEKQNQLVTVLSKQATHLERLFDDMLTMVSLDLTDTLSLDRFDLNRLVADVLEKQRPLADQKACTLQFIPDRATLPIRADEFYLAHAIVKLIQNALQFSPEGGAVTVRTFLVARQAVVEVQDSGPGIQDYDLPHIFSSFYRADHARRTELGGMGLGLTIAKRVAELHHGTIGVESEPTKGSVFHITIPADVPYEVQRRESP